MAMSSTRMHTSPPTRNPAFLGGLGRKIGGLARRALPILTNAIPGPLDDILVDNLMNRGSQPTAGPARPGPGPSLPPPPSRSGPFAIPRFGPMTNGSGGGGGGSIPAAGPCPKGYRLNKSSYHLRDGTFVPKGTRYVKIRKRNPLNPRALRKAIGRVDAGKAWQAKLSGITTEKYTASGKRKD